jgi:hypothetical protein
MKPWSLRPWPAATPPSSRRAPTAAHSVPLSKSAVSRVIATLKGGLEAWRTRSLTDLDVIYVYLDGFALHVRSAGRIERSGTGRGRRPA